MVVSGDIIVVESVRSGGGKPTWISPETWVIKKQNMRDRRQSRISRRLKIMCWYSTFIHHIRHAHHHDHHHHNPFPLLRLLSPSIFVRPAGGGHKGLVVMKGHPGAIGGRPRETLLTRCRNTDRTGPTKPLVHVARRPPLSGWILLHFFHLLICICSSLHPFKDFYQIFFSSCVFGRWVVRPSTHCETQREPF